MPAARGGPPGTILVRTGTGQDPMRKRAFLLVLLRHHAGLAHRAGAADLEAARQRGRRSPPSERRWPGRPLDATTADAQHLVAPGSRPAPPSTQGRPRRCRRLRAWGKTTRPPANAIGNRSIASHLFMITAGGEDHESLSDGPSSSSSVGRAGVSLSRRVARPLPVARRRCTKRDAVDRYRAAPANPRAAGRSPAENTPRRRHT
jgi:hypothetical protein